MLVTMSPGRVARPPGMFSQAGTMPTTLIRGCNSPSAAMVPMTLAAPHMSNFISSILADGLMEIPPVSKVTPLPQIATGAVWLSAPLYCMTIRRAGSSAPCVTESSAPIFRRCISSSSRTSVSRCSKRSANARASSARWDGVQTFAGRLPRSRASLTPAAIAWPSVAPRSASAASEVADAMANRVRALSCGASLLSSSKRYRAPLAAVTVMRAA